MNDILHATFARADDGIRAVESLLYRGVRAEDINLILPESYRARASQTPEGASDSPSEPHPPDASTACLGNATIQPFAGLPAVPPVPDSPPLPPLPVHAAPDVMASGAQGYRYDALGAVIPDSAPTQAPACLDKGTHEAVVDTEQGTGLGLGLGLLTALCVPGIGLIVGSGVIVAGLMGAGTVLGGIAGGLYGYLMDRGVAHGVARVMSDHLAGGGTTLSVSVADPGKEADVSKILDGSGGHLIQEN